MINYSVRRRKKEEKEKKEQQKTETEKEKERCENEERQQRQKLAEEIIDKKITCTSLCILIPCFLILAIIEWYIFSNTTNDKINHLTIATLVFSVYSLLVYNAIEPVIRIVLKHNTKNIHVSTYKEFIDYQMNSVKLISLFVIMIGLIIVVFIYLTFV
ncbi:sodium/glutamate symporter [Mammaliicoccus sciuri]|uniref:Uncharacterized protein n=1 Tax=Mammaliicoccus sciuri TaxID=1296 RepID=A0ABT7I0R8_MAMSC|nr:sodium/glutamate symporter [Mammaliicoccus sciuri]MDL0112760.1 hypothetical protein [Mammaliicoccus sciuri]MDL0118006.1 hypothetical protein [Mammaliicoccus sciuri]